MKIKLPEYSTQEWLFFVLKLILVLVLLFLPFHLGYSFKHYYHVLGFMILPFTLGVIPVLFGFKGIWKWFALGIGTTATLVYQRVHCLYGRRWI